MAVAATMIGLVKTSTAEPEISMETPTQAAAKIVPRSEIAAGASQAPTEPPKATDAPIPTTPPSPFTEGDVRLLAELMTAEAEVVMWDGYKYGVSPYARIAAVGWTALNRLDLYGGTLEEIIKAPHQFAWRSGIQPADWMLTLAEDILGRYWAEKNGEENVGRTLPASYTFFHGDGRENYFREQYEKTGTFWDWSLPDPYDGC